MARIRTIKPEFSTAHSMGSGTIRKSSLKIAGQRSGAETAYPHNAYFERIILGTLMLDGQKALVQCALLRPDHFALDSHRRIYTILLRVLREGIEEPNFAILIDELRHSGELEAVGGAAYLASLTELLPGSLDLGHYVRIVIDSSRRREALRATEIAAKQLRDGQPVAVVASMLAELRQDPAHDATKTPEFSEDALALIFSQRYGADLRYTSALGRWHHWRGTHWGEDSTLNVFNLARLICREQSLLCPLPTVAKLMASARSRAAVESLARADRRHAATVEQWDLNDWLLATPGGTVELATGEMREAQREDYGTHVTAVAPENCPTPVWDAFLQQITNNDVELIAYLQRVAGYSLSGSTRERVLFFLYGTGTNGKSTFVKVLTGILGDGYSRTAPIEAFVESQNDRHPTEIASLRGARLVTAVETEEGRSWAEARLKALTGGDMIAARYMRMDFFEFAPKFKLLIAGNHKPSLRNVDIAIRDRIQIIPFTVTITADKLDRDLSDKPARRMAWHFAMGD